MFGPLSKRLFVLVAALLYWVQPVFVYAHMAAASGVPRADTCSALAHADHTSDVGSAPRGKHSAAHHCHDCCCSAAGAALLPTQSLPMLPLVASTQIALPISDTQYHAPWFATAHRPRAPPLA